MLIYADWEKSYENMEKISMNLIMDLGDKMMLQLWGHTLVSHFLSTNGSEQ